LLPETLAPVSIVFQERLAIKYRAHAHRVKQLKAQLSKVGRRIDEKSAEIQDVDNRMGDDRGKRKENQKAAEALRLEFGSMSVNEDQMEAALEGFRGETRLALENIAGIQATTINKIQARLNELANEIDAAKSPMISEMTSFLREYPEETSDLEPELDYAPEFVTLKDRIEKDELPQQKARFGEFLNRNLIIDMAGFSTRLDEHDKSVQHSIDEVNRSLKNIEFSPGTYIEISRRPTTSHEVNSFRSDLRNCLRGAINPQKEEERIAVFQNIRKLICQFEQQRDWTVRVTDARYWSEYGVRQVRAADNKELNYFSGSGGRSGGQKSILAFMILASAFTTQYGLSGDQNDLNKFRLVVVDEVFSHTDEDNSIRALELFRKLDFQLVVVNPFDAKALLVQDYVDVFQLASASDEVSHLRRFPREDLDKVIKEGAKEEAAEPALA